MMESFREITQSVAQQCSTSTATAMQVSSAVDKMTKTMGDIASSLTSITSTNSTLSTANLSLHADKERLIAELHKRDMAAFEEKSSIQIAALKDQVGSKRRLAEEYEGDDIQEGVGSSSSSSSKRYKAVKAGTSKAGTSKAGTSKAVKAGTSKAGTSKTGTSKAARPKAAQASAKEHSSKGTAPQENSVVLLFNSQHRVAVKPFPGTTITTRVLGNKQDEVAKEQPRLGDCLLLKGIRLGGRRAGWFPGMP